MRVTHGPKPADNEPRPGALERLVARARAALVWEQAWPPLALSGSIVLLFLALSWFDLWRMVPPLARAGGVLAFGALALAALYPLIRIRRPGRDRALARIDRASGAAHRPATALDDSLSGGGGDALTRAFWNLHRDRARRDAKDLSAGLPSPGLARRDPRAFRFAMLLAALVAAVMAGSERTGRVMMAFDWTSPVAPAAPPRLDAWVTPPAYTGRAPVFLTGTAEADALSGTVRVPAGSAIVVRTSGGAADIAPTGALEAAEAPDAKTPATPSAAAVREWSFVLKGPAALTVTPRRGEARSWRFEAIPDRAPEIAFVGTPEASERGEVVLRYRISDDYGVREATGLFAPRPDGVIASPLVDAPVVQLARPRRAGPDNTPPVTTSTHDLQSHPWAGATVAVTLEARDDAGNTSRSATMDVTLPERLFRDPVARALVEQRRRLAIDVGARNSVERALDNLTLYPDQFVPRPADYLNLRGVYWQLREAGGTEQLRAVLDRLWQLAVWFEDGTMGDVQRDLQAARDALRDALERGASEEEIRRLTQDLREAMQRFLAEMMRRMETAERAPGDMPRDMQTVRPQDLMDMLDRLEQMAREGALDDAQDLLSQLDQLLDGLDPNATARMDPMSEEMARMLDELGQMIREQNELRDRTFQEGQGQEQQQQGQPRSGQPRPGQQGTEGLAQDQQSLRERLESLMRQLQEQGLGGNEALGEAGEAMGQAQGQLQGRNAEGALGPQGDALDALRRGAQGMAEQMFGDGNQPGQGGQNPGPGQQTGQRGNDNAVDPLGRPTRSRRYDPGTSVQVPGEIDAQRARRVLDELRRRLSDPSRPQLELDYLERLIEP